MVHAICSYVYVHVCIFCRYNSIYVLDSGSGTAWGKRRLEKGKERRSQEEEEKEKIPIVGEGYSGGGTTYLEVSPQGKIQYTSPITPNSAFHLRNRMLSKLGAKV